jgi:phosphoesterase RecJ-like protein
VSDLDNVIAALRAAPSVAVLSHINPEGDAIGATLGAALALREAGKVTAAYNASPLPPGLVSLPGAETLLREVPIRIPYPCYLVLDTSDLARTGGLLDGRPRESVVVNVDHHAGNTRFGEVNWVEPGASSAGEMVHRLLRHGGFPLSKLVATNLYAAIQTDTGSFQYSNSTPQALRAAADLVECGAAVEEIATGLYENHDAREWRLLSEALATLRVSGDGRLAWIEVTLAAQQRVGIGLEATEGFINYVRSVRGVQIAAVFKEVSPTEVTVSLRSRGLVDVAGWRNLWGRRSQRERVGCTLHLPLATAKERVLAAAPAYLM